MTEVSFCIGCTPSEEPCAQTCVTPGWIELQKLEAEVYRAALIAKFGLPPAVVRMAITTHPHDFGRYAELEIRFDPDDPVAVAYFELIEDGTFGPRVIVLVLPTPKPGPTADIYVTLS